MIDATEGREGREGGGRRVEENWPPWTAQPLSLPLPCRAPALARIVVATYAMLCYASSRHAISLSRFLSPWWRWRHRPRMPPNHPPIPATAGDPTSGIKSNSLRAERAICEGVWPLAWAGMCDSGSPRKRK